MSTDIVFPEGNENEFIVMAERLGFKAVVFAYSGISKIPKEFPKSKIKIFSAVAVPEKELQKSKGKADVLMYKSTGNDRWALEKSPVDIIFELESAQKKDFMHHRASGLNQVLCKIASENEKAVAFSLNSVLAAKSMLKSQILGKMMQNSKFCRKYKVKTIIASFAKSPYQMRAPSELAAFGISAGMHPKEAANSLSWKK